MALVRRDNCGTPGPRAGEWTPGLSPPRVCRALLGERTRLWAHAENPPSYCGLRGRVPPSRRQTPGRGRGSAGNTFGRSPQWMPTQPHPSASPAPEAFTAGGQGPHTRGMLGPTSWVPLPMCLAWHIPVYKTPPKVTQSPGMAPRWLLGVTRAETQTAVQPSPPGETAGACGRGPARGTWMCCGPRLHTAPRAGVGGGRGNPPNAEGPRHELSSLSPSKGNSAGPDPRPQARPPLGATTRTPWLAQSCPPGSSKQLPGFTDK